MFKKGDKRRGGSVKSEEMSGLGVHQRYGGRITGSKGGESQEGSRLGVTVCVGVDYR